MDVAINRCMEGWMDYEICLGVLKISSPLCEMHCQHVIDDVFMVFVLRTAYLYCHNELSERMTDLRNFVGYSLHWYRVASSLEP